VEKVSGGAGFTAGAYLLKRQVYNVSQAAVTSGVFIK
jgi:hypothetical protein